MNFWKRQSDARQRGKFLLFTFFAVLLILIILPYILIILPYIIIYSGITIFQYSGSDDVEFLRKRIMDAIRIWKNPLFYISFLVITTPIIGGAIIQFFRLFRDSGKSVAEMLDGTFVHPSSRGFYKRRLLNIVSEMSIASGVPIPRTYILQKEPGINALVAGKSQNHAVLCVTRGACELLKRDELQGVIAHEFSHLLNGDMAFHTLMLGLLHGFFLSARVGEKLDITSGSGYFFRDMIFWFLKMFSYMLLFPFWLWIYGLVCGSVGKCVKAAFSRSREYLADACAVQFTRYPKGLADSMKTIGALPRWQVIRRTNSLECSHFFFTDGTPPSLMFSLFPSHPPLKKRIKRLDADFDGSFSEIDRKILKKEIFTIKDRIKDPQVLVASALAMECTLPRTDRIDLLTDRLGSFNSSDIAHSEKVIRDVNPELLDMTTSAEKAVMLVYAILTERIDKNVRISQKNLLKEEYAENLYVLYCKAAELLDKKIYSRMILLELAMPALRTLSMVEYDRFRMHCRTLVLMDDKLTLYEYALTTTIAFILDPVFGFDDMPEAQKKAAGQQKNDIESIISFVAWCGADNNAAEAEIAFCAGVKHLPWKDLNLNLQSLQPFDPNDMTFALKSISRRSLRHKKNVIDACMVTIGADSVITPVEWDILRAFAMMLECAMPLLPPSQEIEVI